MALIGTWQQVYGKDQREQLIFLSDNRYQHQRGPDAETVRNVELRLFPHDSM